MAKRLGVVKDPICRWIAHLGLRERGIGRRLEFQPSGVDAWIRAGGSNEEPGANGESK